MRFCSSWDSHHKLGNNQVQSIIIMLDLHITLINFVSIRIECYCLSLISSNIFNKPWIFFFLARFLESRTKHFGGSIHPKVQVLFFSSEDFQNIFRLSWPLHLILIRNILSTNYFIWKFSKAHEVCSIALLVMMWRRMWLMVLPTTPATASQRKSPRKQRKWRLVWASGKLHSISWAWILITYPKYQSWSQLWPDSMSMF